MNITISKKIILRAIITFTVLALVIWGGVLAFSINWQPAPAPLPQDQPAIRALVTMYSVDPSSDRTTWEDKVCSNMTVQGCALFRTMYAPTIWNAATSQKNEVSAAMLQVADTLEDGSQIWKVNVTLNAVTAETFIHVEADPASGQWLLNRLLFTQEAAKYIE